MDETKQPGLQIGQIFLETAQFGHREDALDLPPNTPLGQLNFTFSFEGATTPDEKAGFVRIRVESKPEERPLYFLNVAMMAFVQVQDGHENMRIDEYIRTAGPAMLYPFLREMVGNLTWRGRFGPLWLPPLNVAAVTAETNRLAKGSVGSGRRLGKRKKKMVRSRRKKPSDA